MHHWLSDWQIDRGTWLGQNWLFSMYIVHLYKSAHINIHINIDIFFPPWHFNFSVLLLWLPPHHKCVSNSNVKDQVFCSVLLFQRLDVQARGINLSSLRRSFQWPAIKSWTSSLLDHTTLSIQILWSLWNVQWEGKLIKWFKIGITCDFNFNPPILSDVTSPWKLTWRHFETTHWLWSIPDICHRHYRRCLCKFFLPDVIFFQIKSAKLALYCIMIVHLLCNAMQHSVHCV